MVQLRKQEVARCKQPNTRAKAGVTHADCLRQALEWFTRNNSFANLSLHGNVGWTAVQLVTLAVLWVWSEQRTLTGAFTHASRLSQEMFGTVPSPRIKASAALCESTPSNCGRGSSRNCTG